MLTEVREPFSTMIGYKDCPTNWRWGDAFRTFDPHKLLLFKPYQNMISSLAL